MINNEYYGDLTPQKVREIINNLKGGESLWSQ
jgi:NADH-quinone oxidoreductase subunit E